MADFGWQFGLERTDDSGSAVVADLRAWLLTLLVRVDQWYLIRREPVEVNGEPALAAWRDGRLLWIDLVEVAGGTITALRRVPHADLVPRPRLYEAEPGRARVALQRILAPVGVTHVRAAVTEIDTSRRAVVTTGRPEIGYDRLILAAGSRLVRPEIPGAERLFDVDRLEAAERLAAHLRDRRTFLAIVVGAGFTGLEVATSLAACGRVVLVDRAEVVGPELGPGPRPQIEAALDSLGIERRLGTTITEVGRGHAWLSDGTRLPADAVVWTAGMRASPLTTQIPGARDHLGRLEVDRHLLVTEEVFAAGDTAAARADADHRTVQSCQHAIPLGKIAGHNAAAGLLGLPMQEFAPDPYVTCLDLGAAGAIFTEGWDRQVRDSVQRERELNNI